MSVSPSEPARRASRLHDTSIVIDGTCPGEYWPSNYQQWISGGTDCCVLTVASWESCRDTVGFIASIYQLVRENADRLIIASTTEEIRRAKDDGKLAVVLQFQGTHPLEYDPNLVELFWRLGVRVVQLAYNERSPVCDGCEEPANAGLSSLGRRVVSELNRLGVAIDLSHTGVRASFEAIETSTAPCIVSHANTKALRPSNRNLSDDLIRAVTKKGGVIGLNGFPGFVSTQAKPTLDELIDHMVHIDSIAGSGHVGLGIDYVDQGSQEEYDAYVAGGHWHPETYPPPPWIYPTGIEDPSKLGRLTERLVERGYSDDEIRGVLGENWLRVFDKIWSTK